MARHARNYSNDQNSLEDYNSNGKYDITGESEFTRESTIPYDESEVLSERHYNFVQPVGRPRIRTREVRNRSPDYQGRGPLNYKKSDESISEDICEALYRSSEVDASNIEVFVHNGEVTLKGTVKDRYQKKMAGSCLEHLGGIQDVFNELNILSESDQSSTPGLVKNRTGMI